MNRILRQKEVSIITGISRTSIWRLEKKGLFPKRRDLGAKCVGWLEEDIKSWLETRPPSRNIEKIFDSDQFPKQGGSGAKK